MEITWNFLQLMGEKSLGVKTWHFQFALAFDFRGHRSPQIDAKGIKGELYSEGQKCPLECIYERFS